MNTEALAARRANRDGVRRIRCCAAAALMILGLAGCHGNGSAALAAGGKTMELTSSSIRDGRIPKEYTCDGPDTSPQIAWSAPPAEAKSLALILTDPDAPSGTFTHWILYDIPAETRSLAEDLPKQNQLTDGSRQGRNDFGKTGYGGPCPPRGSEHRYVFRVYALDAKVDLSPGATRPQVEKAMKGHILAQGELTARFGH